MSFLGLGSFGEGFVKGFAESANEALKENIKRINTRIDDIAAFKLKRAIDEQDERKEEKKKIEKAIKEGAAVYGDPNSQEALAFAAGILKEEGSVEAANLMFKQLRLRKGNQPHFQKTLRSMVNIPTSAQQSQPLTTSGIAEAFLGPAKAVDTSIPAGYEMDTGLVGQMFSGADARIQERLQTRIKDDMLSRGLTQDKATGITLPASYFDRDAYIIFNMSPEERVTHYSSIVNDTTNTFTTTEKADAATKVKENLAIIREQEFRDADSAQRVVMLSEDVIKARMKQFDTTLPDAERNSAKIEVDNKLAELGKYKDGRDFIKLQTGTLDDNIAVLERQYAQAPDDKKEEIADDLLILQAEKRRLESFAGTQAQRVAYKIDEAIRTGNSEQLTKSLAEARKIDAVNEQTKNIGLTERSTINRALHNLAVTKMDLHPVFGRGTFTFNTTTGKVEFNGSEQMKDKANAAMAKVIEEITNDAIAVATTEREKQIIREVGLMIGTELRTPQAAPAEEDGASTTGNVNAQTGDVNAQTEAALATGEGETGATSRPLMSGELKQKRINQLRNQYAPDGVVSDASALSFLTQQKTQSPNAGDDQILKLAETISPELKNVVESQLSTYYRNTYETPQDYAKMLFDKGQDETKIYNSLVNVYKADPATAVGIIDAIKARRASEAAAQQDTSPPTLDEQRGLMTRQRDAEAAATLTDTGSDFGSGA